MQQEEQEIKENLDAAKAEAEQAVENGQENTADAGVEPQEQDPVAALQSEVAALQAQLKEVQDKARADLESMARAAAEADNRRKRAEADVDKERKYGNEKLLKALLPVVDSLDLALEHTDKENEALKPVYEGISNTMDLFLKELKNFGVERLDPKGEPFDPNQHQAISMVPSGEVKPNCVLAVMQKGYLLNGRVVRPAMVMVAKALPGASEEPKAEGGKINLEA